MSQYNLNFNLSNSDERAENKALLYTGEDSNTLVLTIKNAGGALPLKAGSPVDERDPDPAGATTLHLAFAPLLAQQASSMRELLVTAPGWKAEFVAGDLATWALTPGQSGSFAAGDELTITISGIVANADLTMGVFSVDYYNLPAGGADTWQANVQVLEPPMQGKADLRNQLAAYWLNSVDSIFVTPPEQASLANELNFTLFYSGSKEIKATNRTKISIYFIYGEAPGYGSLCTKTEADAIDLRTTATYGNSWMGGKNAISASPVWDFRFHGTVFGTEDNSEVDFKISQLKSSLQPGTTQMFITWNKVPEFNDGQISIPIRKNMPPVIKSFTANPAQISVPDQNAMVPVTVSWEVENCDSVSINAETDFALKGETTVLMGYTKQEVLLKAVFGGGASQSVKQRLKVPATIADKPEPVFEKFSLSPQQLYFIDDASYKVTVEWAVQNASEIFFEGDLLTGVKALNGNRLITIPFEEFHQLPDRPDFWALTIKLNAVNLDNTHTSTKSIDLLLSRRRLYEAKLTEIVGVLTTYHGSSYSDINRGALADYIKSDLKGELIPIIKNMATMEIELLPKFISGLQACIDAKGVLTEQQLKTIKSAYTGFLPLMSRLKEYIAFFTRGRTSEFGFRFQYLYNQKADYSASSVDAKGQLDSSINFDGYIDNGLLVALSFHNPVQLGFRPEIFSQQLAQFINSIDKLGQYNFDYQKTAIEGMLAKLNTISGFIAAAYPRAEDAGL